MRLKGKVAIVTGGGSGIGLATAQLFAEEGARLVVAEYTAEAGQAAVEAIRSADGDAIFVQVDVANADQVQKMAQAAIDAYGKIDILYNAAGIIVYGLVHETPDDVWRKVIDINLTGTFLACKYVIPHMIANGGGAIVNTSSSVGWQDACSDAPAYCASKGGVSLLTKQMAIDYAKYKIRVNALVPGPTETPMLRNAFNPSALVAFANTYPMKRLGQPRELAMGVLFLASDEASFVTGALLPVDGGQTAEVSSSNPD
jgi:NAD(P)-dependent dehydrogenase (short-subunit alcohol dehydrogenase family)